MRVVYSNPETGASEWKVLDRKEALAFAAKMKLDLVMVDIKADPPVCRLANFGQHLMEKRSKEKEKKTSQKAKVLKEMYVKAGIDPHDLGIKLGKCKEFLDLGHQVKIVLTAAKVTLAANPLALDETTLKILENLETHVGTVQQPAQSSAMRKDFLLNPKSGTKSSSTKA
jgi:translation initiation factor IF-3